ncbi:hypothetical protein Glove_319g156 [Diversispora epigaea]|uniref:Uncharacterized protein n=1 Tax=Diversispora epigaea TaxID=1348612 RepID=A0A397HWS1_9GLOM|nr:hypothetical protein Glove_319g156 [Diversispora epigaea]
MTSSGWLTVYVENKFSHTLTQVGVGVQLTLSIALWVGLTVFSGRYEFKFIFKKSAILKLNVIIILDLKKTPCPGYLKKSIFEVTQVFKLILFSLADYSRKKRKNMMICVYQFLF